MNENNYDSEGVMMVRTMPYKTKAILLLGSFLLAVFSAALLFVQVSQAQAQDGFYVYTWGGSSVGRPTFPSPPNVPGSLPGRARPTANYIGATAWNQGLAILNRDGHIYTVAAPWADYYMLGRPITGPGSTPRGEWGRMQGDNWGFVNAGNTLGSASSSTTSGNITTAKEYVDFLSNVELDAAGTYAWMISEVENSSGITANPPSNLRVSYSGARYEVRVTVVQQGTNYVVPAGGVVVLRHASADGVVLSPPQAVTNHGNEITFTNTFQRWSSGTNTCAGALSVSKEIDGDFVDPATPFLFNVTLAGTVLCVEGTEFSARLYGPNNNFIRTENFTVNVPRNNVPILDGQTLVFPYLPVGLEWVVEEQAIEGFTARVERVVNGTALATITNPHPELLLSTGTHTITAENLRNDVAFTNIHFITPPMGLFLASGAPYAVVGAAGLMLATLLVLRVRIGRRIEDMPAMY